MKYLIIIFVLLLSACAPQKERPHHRKEIKQVYHLDDGRYAYHDTTNDIWFYYWLFSSTGNSYNSNYYSSKTSANSALPSNGGWVSAPQAPLISSKTSVEEKEVVENESGEPESLNEAHEEQMEFDFSEPSNESNSNNENSGGENSSSSSSESSSSSDSDSSGGGGGE